MVGIALIVIGLAALVYRSRNTTVSRQLVTEERREG
jgi:hypothetical protein